MYSGRLDLCVRGSRGIATNLIKQCGKLLHRLADRSPGFAT